MRDPLCRARCHGPHELGDLFPIRSVIPGESSHNEPFPVTAEAVVAALKAADQLGRTLG